MGNLFGYKKWYKVDKTIEKDGETYTIKKEVGIKRKYLDNESKYVLNINKQKEEDDENKITDEEFINQFIKYKTNNDILKKFKIKFHMGNILFKLKAKESIKKIESYNNFLEKEKAILEIEIYQQSEELRKKENITKKVIIDKAIEDKITEDSNEIKMQIELEKNNFEEIIIYINKKLGKYHIKLKSIENNELTLKRKMYETFKSINANLYIITKNAISNADFKKRNYEIFLKKV